MRTQSAAQLVAPDTQTRPLSDPQHSAPPQRELLRSTVYPFRLCMRPARIRAAQPAVLTLDSVSSTHELFAQRQTPAADQFQHPVMHQVTFLVAEQFVPPARNGPVPGRTVQLNATAAPFVATPATPVLTHSDTPSPRELFLQLQLERMHSELAMTERALHQTLSEGPQATQLKVPPPPPAPPEPQSRTTNHFLARQTIAKDLPLFSGAPEEWPLFSQFYKATTMEGGFSNADNIVRLQKCLQGKAKDAVSGLLAVPDNINEVFRTLELRFGRPELVIGALIQRARNFSTIRSDDFDGIIAFTTSVQRLVGTMSLLNSAGHLYNPQLRQELVSELPASLRLQWGKVMQSSTSGDISFALFSKWLLDIAEAAAHVYVPRTGTQVPDKTGRRPEVNYTITRDPADAKPSSKHDGKKSCDGCGTGEHDNCKCSEFGGKPIRQLWKICRENRLCYACLNRGHVMKDCSRSKICEVDGCQEPHHPLIHHAPRSDVMNDTHDLPADEAPADATE